VVGARVMMDAAGWDRDRDGWDGTGNASEHGAVFDGCLSELFEGVPVPAPVRYRSEGEPELEKLGRAANQPGRPNPGFGQGGRSVTSSKFSKRPLDSEATPSRQVRSRWDSHP